MDKVTRGNTFNVKLSIFKKYKGGREPQPISEIDWMQVYAVSITGRRTMLEFANGEKPNELIVIVDGRTMRNGTYGIVLEGNINTRSIRCSERKAFAIVENNEDADVTFEVYQGDDGRDMDFEFEILAGVIGGGLSAEEAKKLAQEADERVKKELREELEGKANTEDLRSEIKRAKDAERFVKTAAERATNAAADTSAQVLTLGTGLASEVKRATQEEEKIKKSVEEEVNRAKKAEKENADAIKGKAEKVKIVDASEDSLEIEPNKFYRFGEKKTLNITLSTPKEENILNEYQFAFVSGNEPTLLTLPKDVKFLQELSIEANKRYEFSIIDKKCVWGGFDNE